MKKSIIMLTALLLAVQFSRGQSDSTYTKIYRTNPKIEIPTYMAFIGGASFGFKIMDKHASLDKETAMALDPETINTFDRPVAYYDPAHFKSAQKTSDLLLTIFVASPSLLLLDKKIRRDWDDFMSVFLAAHAADNLVYFSSVAAVRRPRPLAFNPAVSIDEKTGEGMTNSFFSGHVTWTATSTFLMTKIYTDYHHIRGWKRIALYTGASIPPAMVGYYRMQAGKHFPTDVLTGFVVGAACGILVPEFHRNKNKKEHFSARPFSMFDANGLTLIYKL